MANMNVSAYMNLPKNEFPEIEGVKVMKTDLDNALDAIYCPDEKTGLPKGDLVLYMSKNTPQDIRTFIQNNLLFPQAHMQGVSKEQEELLFDYMRKDGESNLEYANRMQSVLDSMNTETK